MTKIAKLFQSPQERKMVWMQSVIAVTQEETSEEGMCLDIDGRQAEEGKTVRLTEGNSIGWMLRRETDDG